MAAPPWCGESIGAPEPAERKPAAAALEAGWLLVALLLPLAANPWARQPFEPAKAAMLRALVWGLAALWLASGLVRGRLAAGSVWRQPLGRAALVLFVTQALATLLAPDPSLSLWGSYERAQGLLTLSAYLLLFALVGSRLRGTGPAWRLVGALVASGPILVAVGLAQAAGWSSGGLVSDARSPVFATLGRSNFLGAYLAMLLPLTLAVALVPGGRRRWQRPAAGLLALAEVVVLVLTLSRGAWLAAAIAVATLALLWRWPCIPAGRRRLLLAAGPGLLAALAAAGWGLAAAGGSGAARLTIWQATVRLIAARPLLGYGPDGLGLAFARVYPPQLVYYQGRGLAVDRAHNLFLDWTATAGAAGLAAGLALLVVAAVTAWRALGQAGTHDPDRRVLLAAVLAALAGNVAGNMVGFDTLATATATWLLLGLLAGLSGAGKRGDLPPLPAASGPAPRALQAGRWALAGLLLLAAAGAVVQGSLRPQAADVLARRADRSALAGDWPAAAAAGEQAVRLWPGEPAHRLALSWTCLQVALSTPGDPQPWLQRAEEQLLAARDRRPGDAGIWAALGELNGQWANRWPVSTAARLALAHAAYRQATRLAPNHAALYTAWGLVDLEAGKAAAAAARFRQAVDLDATDAWAFWHLGDAELAQGRVEAAQEAYFQAIRWRPDLAAAHLGLARCYLAQGRPAAARATLLRVLAIDPGNAAASALYVQVAEQ